MQCVLSGRALQLTVAIVVCLFQSGSHASIEPSRGAGLLNVTDGIPGLQTEVQHEWVVDEVVDQYSQESSFSLITFNVPRYTEKAEFRVTFYDQSKDRRRRDVIMSFRLSAIPVIQAYNVNVPDSFIVPNDQQTYLVNNNGSFTVTLTSPTPGRVYILASVLNPLEDVIQYLRWGEKLKGDCAMDVQAVFTRRIAVTSLAIDDINTVNVSLGKTQTFSFVIPAFSATYSLIISNCSGPGNESRCPVHMTTSESLSQNDPSSVSVDCQTTGKGQPCLLQVTSPKLDSEHFVTFSANGSGVEKISFDVSFEFGGCASAAATSYTYEEDGEKAVFLMHYKNAIGYDAVHNDVLSNHACLSLGPLGRVSEPPDDFKFRAYFGTVSMKGDILPNFDVIASDEYMVVHSFIIKDSVDTGGSLHLSATLKDDDWDGTIWVCPAAHRVAQNGTLEQCPNGALMTLNTTKSKTSRDKEQVYNEVFLPFPLSGTWYISMQCQCQGSSGPEPCKTLPMIEVSVKMVQCATDQCGQYGTCQQYIEGTTLFASCECHAGYRGLSCNDASHALTDSEMLIAVYLLTLSNLAFIPAICIALHRHFFELAAVFTFNMFFSCFYHACDASHVFKLCIMEYKTLAFGDFFGSVLSFYTMLATMARIPETLRTSLLMCGTLAIAAIITNDINSDVAHIVPIVLIGLVLFISWVFQMRIRKKLFPSKRRYLLYILPGLVLAVTGIGINYGLMYHLSSYKFTHSFWHLSLMVAPCFLMPPRRKSPSVKNQKDQSVSAQDIIRTVQQIQSASSPHHGHNAEPQMWDADTRNVNSDQEPLI